MIADATERKKETAVRLGASWRVVERAYPTESDPPCVLFQLNTSGEWKTVKVLKPDGTFVP